MVDPITERATYNFTVKLYPSGQLYITSSERYAKISNQKVKQEYRRTMRKVLRQNKV